MRIILNLSEDPHTDIYRYSWSSILGLIIPRKKETGQDDIQKERHIIIPLVSDAPAGRHASTN